jgi:hypothetical protein
MMVIDFNFLRLTVKTCRSQAKLLRSALKLKHILFYIFYLNFNFSQKTNPINL